jgi:hypothetical protein
MQSSKRQTAAVDADGFLHMVKLTSIVIGMGGLIVFVMVASTRQPGPSFLRFKGSQWGGGGETSLTLVAPGCLGKQSNSILFILK